MSRLEFSKKIPRSAIKREWYACPYCGKEHDQHESPGCCGESAAHLEQVILLKNGPTLYATQDDFEINEEE